jgi:hypothetical protein
MININDKRFLTCLKNTIDDLKYSNSDEIDGLKEIQRTKTLTLMSVSCLYTILKLRELNMDYIKQIQDKSSFKIVNREHDYMRRLIERYFDIEDIGSTPERITCAISRKEVA